MKYGDLYPGRRGDLQRSITSHVRLRKCFPRRGTYSPKSLAKWATAPVRHLREPFGEVKLGAQQGLTAWRLLGIGRFEVREFARQTKLVGRRIRGQGNGG